MSAASACQKPRRLLGHQSKGLFRCFGPLVKPALLFRSLQGEVKVGLGFSLQGKCSPVLPVHIGFLLQRKPKCVLSCRRRAHMLASPAWQAGSAGGRAQLPAFICPRPPALPITWWHLGASRRTPPVSRSAARRGGQLAIGGRPPASRDASPAPPLCETPVPCPAPPGSALGVLASSITRWQRDRGRRACVSQDTLRFTKSVISFSPVGGR